MSYKIKFHRHLLFFPIYSIFLVNCTSIPNVIQTYPGAALTKDKHAVLEINEKIPGFGLQKVDDKFIMSYIGGSFLEHGTVNKSVSLLPGAHKITLSYASSDAVQRRAVEGNLICNLEAGHTYIAQLNTDSISQFHFWVEDKSSKKLVAMIGLGPLINKQNK